MSGISSSSKKKIKNEKIYTYLFEYVKTMVTLSNKVSFVN